MRGLVSRIVVVDSGSTDATVDIARVHGAEVYMNSWINYANQFNWALDNCNIQEDWCLRIDADEYLSAELKKSIQERVCREQVSADIVGFSMKRIMIFMGRPMRWGGIGDLYMLRLFRTGHGRCEQRWMDEHIALEGGKTRRLKGRLIDHNLNNIGWWINKHNNYATREAIDLLSIRYRFEPQVAKRTLSDNPQAAYKRWLKEKIYVRLPGGVRAMMYFCWRFFFKLGILDGRQGLVFHFLQGLWYRMLVDLKVAELEKKAINTGKSISSVIELEYGYAIGSDNK
jgi:glycosyltransferase involved in cell wall biosynthesis